MAKVKNNKFLRFLRSKLLLPLGLGLLIFPLSFAVFTRNDNEQLDMTAFETMRFMRGQIERFDNFDARSTAVEMTMTTDRALSLSRAFSVDANLMYDRHYLQDFVYSQRLDGILVLDAGKNVDVNYYLNPACERALLEKLHSIDIDDIIDYPTRCYMDQFKDKRDRTHSYAVVARKDKPGYIVCYSKESPRSVADKKNYLEGLFNNHGFKLDGTLMVSDKAHCIASNKSYLANKALTEFLPADSLQPVAVGNGLSKIDYKGHTYLGRVEIYNGYTLSAFFPTSTVYSNRSRNMLYVLMSYILLCLVVMYLNYRSSAALNEQLKQSAKLAQRANEAKTNFLFNMSHDIRTPMNAILGYAGLMKDELHNPAKLADYQAKIEQSGNLLLDIINNVLDMARIESGKMEIVEDYYSIRALASELHNVFETEAVRKDIQLICKCTVEHDYVLCDATKVKQLFANLMSNAIKYTLAGGKIIITCTELPSAKPDYIKLKTVVSDTGIGMSKDYLPTIFDSFTRERNTTTSKIVGTGLGMAIVKRLVSLMGGSIEVESELGKGTKFTVVLEHKLADEQYYAQQQDAEAADSRAILKNKHILLAEDNELNAEIAMVVLEDMGLVVEHVEDGVQCVARLEEKPAGTYDLILMDVQMPNMDGYTATRTIRGLADKTKAMIPIVAMTANAFEEDKQNALDAGMNGHIAKPIDVAKVEKTLIELLK